MTRQCLAQMHVLIRVACVLVQRELENLPYSM